MIWMSQIWIPPWEKFFSLKILLMRKWSKWWTRRRTRTTQVIPWSLANAADKINMETLFGRLRFLKAFDAMREIRHWIYISELDCFDYDFEWQGTTVSTQPGVFSPRDCQKLCALASGCGFFVYQHDTRICNLRASKSGVIGNNLIISGPRNCTMYLGSITFLLWSVMIYLILLKWP